MSPVETLPTETLCRNCRYWAYEGVARENAYSDQQCRYHAPIASLTVTLSRYDAEHAPAIWPKTSAKDWCGAWELFVAQEQTT